jgi:peptidyl-prolyl cis-trans isomerase C
MEKSISRKIKWGAIIGGVVLSLVVVSVIAIGQDKGKDVKSAEVSATQDNAVLAEVNGAKITVGDFYAQMKRLSSDPQVPQDSPQLRQKLLDGLIKEELLKQEAQKQGIDKDPVVLKDVEQMKEQLIVRELVNREVIEKVKSVDDKDLKAYYDENKAQFPAPEQVHARHILVSTKPEADAIKAQLDKGADFAKLAIEKSIDKTSGARGGDLGFFGKGDMIPEFEKVAFSLAPGKISSPVKTQFGYHIIKLEGKKAAGTMKFEDAKPNIERRLIAQKQRERLDSWLASLEKNAKVTSNPELIGIPKAEAPKPMVPIAPIAPATPEKK